MCHHVISLTLATRVCLSKGCIALEARPCLPGIWSRGEREAREERGPRADPDPSRMRAQAAPFNSHLHHCSRPFQEHDNKKHVIYGFVFFRKEQNCDLFLEWDPGGKWERNNPTV